MTDAHLVLGRICRPTCSAASFALDVERARARDRRARRAAARAWRRGGRRAASSPSSTTTWSAPSASCRSSAATIRATSRCCRSAAPGRCTAARSPRCSACAPIVVPPGPACSRRSGCWSPTSRRSSRAPACRSRAPSTSPRRRRACSASSKRRRGPGSTPRACPARRAASRGRPTCATSTRASSSPCRGRQRDVDAASAPLHRGLPRLHERLYTFAQEDTPVEIVTLRVAAAGRRPPLPRLPRARPARRPKRRAPRRHRACLSRGAGLADVPPSSRATRSAPARSLDGPAIVDAARRHHRHPARTAGHGRSRRQPDRDPALGGACGRDEGGRRRCPTGTKRRASAALAGDPITREIIRGALRAAQTTWKR